jgi:hypothetical protein
MQIQALKSQLLGAFLFSVILGKKITVILGLDPGICERWRLGLYSH